MTKKETLINELENLPEPAIDEVLEFVQFLKFRKKIKPTETMLLSENSLKREWLSDDEDEAWTNL